MLKQACFDRFESKTGNRAYVMSAWIMSVHDSSYLTKAPQVLYLNMGPIVVAHGHLRQLIAYLNHGIIKYSGEALVIIEPFNGVLDKVQAQAIFVSWTTEEVWNNSVVLRIRRAPATASQQIGQRGKWT